MANNESYIELPSETMKYAFEAAAHRISEHLHFDDFVNITGKAFHDALEKVSSIVETHVHFEKSEPERNQTESFDKKVKGKFTAKVLHSNYTPNIDA